MGLCHGLCHNLRRKRAALAFAQLCFTSHLRCATLVPFAFLPSAPLLRLAPLTSAPLPSAPPPCYHCCINRYQIHSEGLHGLRDTCKLGPDKTALYSTMFPQVTAMARGVSNSYFPIALYFSHSRARAFSALFSRSRFLSFYLFLILLSPTGVPCQPTIVGTHYSVCTELCTL
jgi:hypothetical protein